MQGAAGPRLQAHGLLQATHQPRVSRERSDQAHREEVQRNARADRRLREQHLRRLVSARGRPVQRQSGQEPDKQERGDQHHSDQLRLAADGRAQGGQVLGLLEEGGHSGRGEGHPRAERSVQEVHHESGLHGGVVQ